MATVQGFAASDKSKPYIALNSIAKDRGYIGDLATATCLCGAVQLAFVSSISMTAQRTQILTHSDTLADGRASIRVQLRLQLQRLPQAHSVHVRLQLRH